MKAYRLLIVQIFNFNIREWFDDFKELIPVSTEENLEIIKDLKKAFYRRVAIGEPFVVGKYMPDRNLYLICSSSYLMLSNICYLEILQTETGRVFNLQDKLNGQIIQGRIEY